MSLFCYALTLQLGSSHCIQWIDLGGLAKRRQSSWGGVGSKTAVILEDIVNFNVTRCPLKEHVVLLSQLIAFFWPQVYYSIVSRA